LYEQADQQEGAQAGRKVHVHSNVLRYMESNYPYLGPVLLFAGQVLGLTSDVWGSPTARGVVVAVALTLVFIGGFIHFYSLLVAYYIGYRLQGRDPPIRVILYAALLVSLYFLLVGVALSARLYRNVLEAAVGAPVEETLCGEYYNPWLHAATLGLLLAPFVRCAFLSISRVLAAQADYSEPPEDLGSVGDEW